jgi:hypothetical protein
LNHNAFFNQNWELPKSQSWELPKSQSWELYVDLIEQVDETMVLFWHGVYAKTMDLL